MNNPKIKIAVSKPRNSICSELSPVPEESPCLDITADPSISKRLIKAAYYYQLKHRDKPTHYLLSPEEYLSFTVDLSLSTQRYLGGFSLSEQLIFNGIPVLPVVDGLAINLKNLSHITWDRAKQKASDE